MITQEIWQYTKEKNIWLSSAHIPGKFNVVADAESRMFETELEWQLNPIIFQSLQDISPLTCTLDLFASKLNTQLDSYVSYRPDPGAFAVDAFTLNWRKLIFYAFPLFAILPKLLQKISLDEATGLLLIPFWPSQVFFSSVLHMLIAHPIFIHRNAHLVRFPAQPERKHSLHGNLNFLACPISGSPSQQAAYQGQLKIIQSWRGKTQAQYSTYLNKWADFCSKRNESPLCAPVAVCLDYLVSLYEDGLSYSTINTASSAIST